jgi:arginine repressor
VELPDLLGTVAGDDTVLVVPRSTRRIKALRRQIEQTLLGG